jgi:putative Mg2+ transporter-C (MgtC) family protein
MGWLSQALGLGREIVVPLAAALALGALIGWERERRHKPAGLRTHMLVSLGAATFTLVTLAMYESVLRSGAELSCVDPLRIVQGVIGGIGFLGAGAIIRDRGSVEGLTTAGTVWLAGAVCLACGRGRFATAGAATLLVIAALTTFRFFERSVFRTK